MPTIKKNRIHFTGPQIAKFDVGRQLRVDEHGNVHVVDPGREINLVPAKMLEPDKQDLFIDAADWKALCEHKIYKPVIDHYRESGQLHDYGIVTVQAEA